MRVQKAMGCTRGLYLSLAVESMRFRTISDNTSAAAPARPPEAAPKSATSIGTNLRKPLSSLLSQVI